MKSQLPEETGVGISVLSRGGGNPFYWLDGPRGVFGRRGNTDASLNETVPADEPISDCCAECGEAFEPGETIVHVTAERGATWTPYGPALHRTEEATRVYHERHAPTPDNPARAGHVGTEPEN